MAESLPKLDDRSHILLKTLTQMVYGMKIHGQKVELALLFMMEWDIWQFISLASDIMITNG